jgi:hypothetical protein
MRFSNPIRITSAKTPRYGMGWQPSPPGHKFTSFAVVKARLATTTPSGSADLSQWTPQVMDQGQTGSCTGHAFACTAFTSLTAAGLGPTFVASPLGIYDVERCIDRTPNPDGTLPPLTDEGAMPDEGTRGIQEWGVRAIQAPTSDGRYSDCDPATINDEPNFLDLEQDASYQLVGAYQITTLGQAFLDDCAIALDNRFAVSVASLVDSAFENWTPDQAPLSPPNRDDILGGHEISLIAYTTSADGRVWTIRNSWGAGWGLAGNVLVSDEWMSALQDARVMSVRPKGAA